MLSQILKKLRENSGCTQQQIADALNIDRSTYAYYETGKTTPDINTIIKLSKIFNVPYTDIFEDEENDRVAKLNDSFDEDENISSRYGRKNNKHIYELTKQEQQIVIGYRLLPIELQKEVLGNLYSYTQNLTKKKKKED